MERLAYIVGWCARTAKKRIPLVALLVVIAALLIWAGVAAPASQAMIAWLGLTLLAGLVVGSLLAAYAIHVARRGQSELRALIAREARQLDDKLTQVRRKQIADAATTAVLADRIKVQERQISDVTDAELSFAVISALKALRPLLLGGETLDGGPEQHGHDLLMRALVERERSKPGWLEGRTIVEVGTTRERSFNQRSTERLGLFSALLGMSFVSVDMDPHNTQNARRGLRLVHPGATAVTAKGEDYLHDQSHAQDIVYLDAFDFDHGKHSDVRKQRYREFLDTDITDAACWEMHKICAEALVKYMPEGGIVAIDDTWTDEAGAYDGKGKLAVPLLLKNGFEIVGQTPNAVALTKTRVLERA